MNIKKGDKVAILNTTTRGKLIVEGFATVIEPPLTEDGYAYVSFNAGEINVARRIDLAAQADPDAYVAEVNRAAAFLCDECED